MGRPSAPTAVTWGVQDRLALIKYAYMLQKKIPGSRLVSIGRAGHMPQIEQPGEFLSAIRWLTADTSGSV